MELVKILLIFISGFATILICDYIWLGYIVKRFTIAEFGSLIVVENGSIKVNLTAGIFAWISIVALVYFFVLKSGYASSSWSAIGYGALMGGLSYAMYDLTNLTFLKNYSLHFTLVDIVWGVFLCSIVALVMYQVDILVNKIW
ncbi:DUF2177 family protein [Candidatus Gracilibacteria bacterium]|nr:DUF2177 family protein [Candidatus Gracilibacteria bacterium]